MSELLSIGVVLIGGAILGLIMVGLCKLIDLVEAKQDWYKEN